MERAHKIVSIWEILDSTLSPEPLNSLVILRAFTAGLGGLKRPYSVEDLATLHGGNLARLVPELMALHF